jgi:hypothetical protein
MPMKNKNMVEGIQLLISMTPIAFSVFQRHAHQNIRLTRYKENCVVTFANAKQYC